MTQAGLHAGVTVDARRRLPGRGHTAGADSRGGKTSRARREAAAMAAAHAETTRIKNQALDNVLKHVLATISLSDEAKERITEVIAQGGGTRPPEGVLLNVYEDLTGGLVTAVVEAVNDGNDEETFSVGSTVVVKNHDLEPGSRWPHNEFLWGNGPAAEFPPGCESTVNFPPQPRERLR